VSRLARAHDTLGDEAQFLQVSDAASTVLLDDDGHGHQPIALKRKTKNENEERKRTTNKTEYTRFCADTVARDAFADPGAALER
jgi:hypothetical protein